MALLDKYNFKELLGLEVLSEEDFNAFLKETYSTVYLSSFNKAEEKGLLPQEIKLKALEMQEKGESQENINEYLIQSIPSIIEIMEEEIDKLKVKMLLNQVNTMIKTLESNNTITIEDKDALKKMVEDLSSNITVENLIPKYHELRKKYNF